MNKSKWLVLILGLGMMAATGAYLASVHAGLGAPGVKLGPVPLYDELGHLAARQSVLLPDTVLGLTGSNLPVTRVELDNLPADTTFGRKLYSRGEGYLSVMTSVVLMGNDRTSIHDPHYCLEAQDWHIGRTERVMLPMNRPIPYQLPVLKLTATRQVLNEYKLPMNLSGIYVYWFVSADQLTSDQGTRLWSIAKKMVEKRELERWAYISYFTACLPGREEATFKQLEHFIQASAPDIQTVHGQPTPPRSPVASR